MSAEETPTPPQLDLKDAAAYIGMSESWLYRQVEKKKVPHLRLGRAIKFRLVDLNRWLDAHLVKPQ